MAKKIEGYIKLQIPAGQANPSPPVGPALGQAGLNIMEFCKAFNAATQSMEQGMPVPVKITVYADKSFSYDMKSPPASFFIKKAANIQKGASIAGQETVGSITRAQIEEIVEQKKDDLNAHNLDQACKIIAGTARSMGISVEGM